jgi:hypothetical protein
MMGVLSELARRARQAGSDRELGFLLVNETLDLAYYRQAALWLADEGVWSLSGVVQVDANVPYAQWLDAVARHLQEVGSDGARLFSAMDLPPELADQWAQWWPENGLWLASSAPGVTGGAIFVSDEVWSPSAMDARRASFAFAEPVGVKKHTPPQSTGATSEWKKARQGNVQHINRVAKFLKHTQCDSSLPR